MKYILKPGNSINEAIKSLNDGDTLYLEAGIYDEKVISLKSNIKIIGEDESKVILKNKNWFTKIMDDYNECNTFRTYTLYVGGENVEISNLTIINEAVPSKRYGQALALYADCNNLLLKNVTLKSAQDTLFTGPLPLDLIERHQGFLPEFQLEGHKCKQIYDNCTIYGDVDFIFGSAQALFINCDIISIAREKTDIDGYLSAPSHYKEDKYGYLFYKCNLICEDGVENVYLSRPWRDYGTAAFIDCKTGAHINKEGFSNWGNTKRYDTAKYYEYNDELDLSNRVKWAHILNKDSKEEYLNEFFKLVGYKK